MAIKLHSSFAVHPGEWLRTEIVEPHNLTVGAAAEHLGVTRQTLSKLMPSDLRDRVEKSVKLVELALRDGIVLVIVAARATGCQSQPHGGRGLDPVHYVLDGVLFGHDTTLAVAAMIAAMSPANPR